MKRKFGRWLMVAGIVLGLGVAPPTPSWGSMVKEGFVTLSSAPWIALVPGICIFLLVISINLLGDRLNDWINPFMKTRGTL